MSQLVELTNTILLVPPSHPAAEISTGSPPPPVTVVLFNATTVTLTSITIGSSIVSPLNGLAGFSSGQAPVSCSTIQAALNQEIQVTFGSNGWTSNLQAGPFPGTVYIWCFADGFVLTTSGGQMAQIAVQ